ncbi:DUF4163 domain-containing protein [Novosphingobium malaysiense]|uniref:Deacetylase PdaC domain-containing protein n=1 Tax=Novosphingobium malaysiense TaxID=1348853 RepID=A0A0B1ZUB4_9SPHN|nr:DUF4163 domain-containing protein [Novosphingobium malaysiense]KHK92722.1 hypothetical protein LK12_06655 [Novosphingobium malaysiense]
MRIGRWAAALVLVTSACQGGGDASDPRAGAEQATTMPEAAITLPEATGTDAAALPSESVSGAALPSGRSVEVSNDLYEFTFSYPDAAGAIPQLKDLLDSRLYAARDQLASSARDERKAARQEGFPYNPHSYVAKWAEVTNLPNWLSLSAEIYTYTGGAHGMSAFDSLLWDRRAETARKPRDLFASTDALRQAIREPFCDALDKEREKRRGEPVMRGSGQTFTECIDPIAQTLILGSSNGETFDRLGILVGPYEAGPYAEGTYDITLPVTGKVMAVLKPQYRTGFSVGQ